MGVRVSDPTVLSHTLSMPLCELTVSVSVFFFALRDTGVAVRAAGAAPRARARRPAQTSAPAAPPRPKLAPAVL
jgi:hypothetical protein